MSNNTGKIRRAKERAARAAAAAKSPKGLTLGDVLGPMSEQINANTRMIAELERVVSEHDKWIRANAVPTEGAPDEPPAPQSEEVQS